MNEALYDARTTRKLSQEKVAKRAGINRSFYTRIEGGHIPGLRTAYKIAEALDERVENIFLPSYVLKQNTINVSSKNKKRGAANADNLNC